MRPGERGVRACVAAVGLAVVAGMMVGCNTSGPVPTDEHSYVRQLQQDRAAKDASFRADSDSPIPAAERASFPGLAYYPIDPSYRVPAVLTRENAQPPIIINMETSTHVPRRMQRIGTLAFSLQGNEYHLAAFIEAGTADVTHLFVPFGDLTNGGETYRGGRYLDLDRTPTGLYDLDFNLAYHPYCLYNPTFECPIPPRENQLLLPLRAGERLAPWETSK